MAEQDWLAELDAAIAEPRPPGRYDARRHQDDGALEPVTTAAASNGDLDVRLARIEALLEADLDKLGPAVLAESISELEARMSALAIRLDAMVSVVELVRKTVEPIDGDPNGAGVENGAISARLDELSTRLDTIGKALLG